MKLTWFGGTIFRIQIGGQIVVVDAHEAPEGIAASELTAGADRLISLDDALPVVDSGTWKRRPAQRLLDSGEALRRVDIWSVGSAGVLIDGDEDRPLLILTGEPPHLGRWADEAVVVLAGRDIDQAAGRVLDAVSPHLMVLAASDEAVAAAIGAVRDRLDGTGMVALEPGLAVEA